METREYINIQTPDQEAYADCWVVEDNSELTAQCSLFGPKRGDEIFDLVQKALQETANRNGLPLRHVYTSSNKGALALIERNSEYRATGTDTLGNNTFERVYTPQTNTVETS